MIGYSARHLALGVILAFVAGEHSLAVVALIVDVSAAAINAHCRHHQRVVAVYGLIITARLLPTCSLVRSRSIYTDM